MSGPLADSWAKLSWANRHADALYEEASAYADGDAAQIALDEDPQTGVHVFRMNLREEPPVQRWGLILGDILHNLHSALDCLAWQLAIAKLGRDPTDREARSIYFPLAKRPVELHSLTILRYVTTGHGLMLKNVQPYQRGYAALGVLPEFSRRDKHRVVHPTYLVNDEFSLPITIVRDCEVVEIVRAPPGPFVDGRELARVQIRATGPQAEIEGHAQLAGYIALSDGTALQHLLDEIGAKIRTILETFEPTLSKYIL